MQPMGAPPLSTRAMEAQISCSGAALIAVGGLAAPATPPTHFLSFTMSAWGKPRAAFMLLMVGLGTPVQVASSSPWCSTAPPSRQTPASHVPWGSTALSRQSHLSTARQETTVNAALGTLCHVLLARTVPWAPLSARLQPLRVRLGRLRKPPLNAPLVQAGPTAIRLEQRTPQRVCLATRAPGPTPWAPPPMQSVPPVRRG